MKREIRRSARTIFPVMVLLVTVGIFHQLVNAQNPEMQQKIADIKQAAAANKQAMAQYTWVEQVTISIKGEEKKQEQYQVQMGPDGKPQKTPIGSPDSAGGGGGRHGRLKEHVVEKKKEEYKDYADQIKALIQQYVPPDPGLIQQAAQQGNILSGPEGAPGQYRVVINNYVKQGDKMTLVVDKAQKNLVSVSIDSFLNDPKDAVNMTAQFTPIPGGPNHVSSETINGVSKQLTINVQNSNYQKL